MTILHDPNLVSSLNHKWLFLDANTFVAALYYNDPFGNLLIDLKNQGCALVTIPSVLFEFTRGSKSVKDFIKRSDFIQNLASIYPIQNHIKQLMEFTVVCQRVNPQISFTDFLLIACLYKFPDSYVLTENHKDFSLDILNRQFIISLDTGKDIRNHAIYRLSKIKFDKAAAAILKSNRQKIDNDGEGNTDDIPF